MRSLAGVVSRKKPGVEVPAIHQTMSGGVPELNAVASCSMRAASVGMETSADM